MTKGRFEQRGRRNQPSRVFLNRRAELLGLRLVEQQCQQRRTYRAPSAGQASFVVAENLLGRSVVERRQLGTALCDFTEFVAQPPALGSAPQSSEAFP